jgi:hypothetical protein
LTERQELGGGFGCCGLEIGQQLVAEARAINERAQAA